MFVSVMLPAKGYLAYPLTVSSNVLNSFPNDDTYIQASTAVRNAVGHLPATCSSHLFISWVFYRVRSWWLCCLADGFLH